MVTHEIRQAFLTPDDVCSGSNLNGCTYLRACIDESLRLAPPAPGALWREVISDGVVIDGQRIPIGCDVGTAIYAIHHHPDYFPDPFVFQPERWLAISSADDAALLSHTQRAFAPFSLGPRSCVARGLAISELMLTMATLLSRFDMRLVEDSARVVGSGRPGGSYGRHRANEFQLFDHIAAAKDGPLIQFRERFYIN